MIRAETQAMKRAKELRFLIAHLEEIPFKALHKADAKIKELGWHREGKAKIWMRIDGDFFDVYEYTKPFETLPDLIAMLKRQCVLYVNAIDYRSLTTTPLIEFLDQNFGENEELSPDQFEWRKADALDALRLAFEYLNSLKDCQNARYDQVTPEGL